jgi:hypothetical protein
VGDARLLYLGVLLVLSRNVVRIARSLRPPDRPFAANVNDVFEEHAKSPTVGSWGLWIEVISRSRSPRSGSRLLTGGAEGKRSYTARSWLARAAPSRWVRPP